MGANSKTNYGAPWSHWDQCRRWSWSSPLPACACCVCRYASNSSIITRCSMTWPFTCANWCSFTHAPTCWSTFSAVCEFRSTVHILFPTPVQLPKLIANVLTVLFTTSAVYRPPVTHSVGDYSRSNAHTADSVIQLHILSFKELNQLQHIVFEHV